MSITHEETKQMVDWFKPYFILDEDGKPKHEPDSMKWAAWFEKSTFEGTRIVSQNDVEDGVRVSTVFLGLSHNFMDRDGSDPILYETMIFGGHHDMYQKRYRTRAQAMVGHAQAVALAAGVITEEEIEDMNDD